MPVTRPARRNACGAFSCPTPCAPALEGTPMSPILLSILHLSFLNLLYWMASTRTYLVVVPSFSAASFAVYQSFKAMLLSPAKLLILHSQWIRLDFYRSMPLFLQDISILQYIMRFHKIHRRPNYPRRADQSAVCAINRVHDKSAPTG